jgi:hypothetical protein
MIRVGITTYNRPEMLARLVDALDSPYTDIVIYDDGSEPPASSDVATVYRYDENAGKDFWYLRVRDMLEDALDDEDWEYLFWTPDDLEPAFPHVLERMVAKFDLLKRRDENAVCLNPLKLVHHPTAQWVNFDPVRVDGGWQTQWMDCCGLVDRRFCELAVDLLRDFRPSFIRNLSTGVGKRLSIGMHEAGFTLYQTSETYFLHGDHQSRMTPEGRIDRLVT